MRIKHLALPMLILGLCSAPARAQERLTEHTLKLSAGKQSPAATIADMAWLAGHWVGDGLGGATEEVWSPPRNGVMMGMFRLFRGDKPIFYELLTLAEEKGSLTLRLKHFNADLTGWEEKDKTIDFPFITKADGVAHFDGLAWSPEGEDAMTIYLAIRRDGNIREEKFHLRRVSALRLGAQSLSAEEEAARVPLENYLKGHATGDGEFMRKAFHPDAKIFSFRDGKLNQMTSAEFAARFTGKPAPDEAQRKRRIESVKITGNAGVGVIALDYPTVKFTDYMSLLKVDGEWKIINKTFYAEPKTKP
jgi:hypothetical protein